MRTIKIYIKPDATDFPIDSTLTARLADTGYRCEFCDDETAYRFRQSGTTTTSDFCLPCAAGQEDIARIVIA